MQMLLEVPPQLLLAALVPLMGVIYIAVVLVVSAISTINKQPRVADYDKRVSAARKAARKAVRKERKEQRKAVKAAEAALRK